MSEREIEINCDESRRLVLADLAPNETHKEGAPRAQTAPTGGHLLVGLRSKWQASAQMNFVPDASIERNRKRTASDTLHDNRLLCRFRA